MWRGVTAVSTLRDALTFIVNESLRKFDIWCTPDIVATFIVAIRKLWPLFLGQNTFILLYSDWI